VSELCIAGDGFVRNEVQDCGRSVPYRPRKLAVLPTKQSEPFVDETSSLFSRVLVASDSQLSLPEVLVIVVQF
jgi:hypothetical protein